MPKPMMIVVHVEEVAFGKVWRTLDTMPGVIKLELQSEAKPHHKNGDNRGSWRKGFNLRAALLPMLEKPRHIDEMRKFAEQNGRAPGSINSATSAFQRLGLAKSNGSGIWSLTAKGKAKLEAMKKAVKAEQAMEA